MKEELYVVTVYSSGDDYDYRIVEINDQAICKTEEDAKKLVKKWYKKWYNDQKEYIIPEEEDDSSAYYDDTDWCIESCDDGNYCKFICEIRKMEVR